MNSVSLNLFCLDQENTTDKLVVFPSSNSVMAHGIQQLLFRAFANTNDQEKNLKVRLQPLRLIGLFFISQTLMSVQELTFILNFF